MGSSGGRKANTESMAYRLIAVIDVYLHLSCRTICRTKTQRDFSFIAYHLAD